MGKPDESKRIETALRCYWDSAQCGYLADRLASDGFTLAAPDSFGVALVPSVRDSAPIAIREAAQSIAFTEMRHNPGDWQQALRSAVDAIFDFLTTPVVPVSPSAQDGDHGQ